jgi:hypothetical protein
MSDFIERALSRPRCLICDWPLMESEDQGCTVLSCSYRPEEGSPEYCRIKQRRDAIERMQSIPQETEHG